MDKATKRQLPESQSNMAYETTDASAYYVGLFALGLAIMIALTLLFLIWLFWRFEASAKREDPVQSPVAANQRPPAPRLQTQSSADLAKLRHEEDKRLGSYQWIDQQQGIVQVPIARAIDLLAERGLPEPKEAAPQVEEPQAEPPSTKQEAAP